MSETNQDQEEQQDEQRGQDQQQQPQDHEQEQTTLGGSGSSSRRSVRSDTLGSTGSSRSSSCDEPTISALCGSNSSGFSSSVSTLDEAQNSVSTGGCLSKDEQATSVVVVEAAAVSVGEEAVSIKQPTTPTDTTTTATTTTTTKPASQTTNSAQPFESIKETIRKNSQIPNAQVIQHINKLISRNEAIVENWNHISIRSYNSNREQNCSTTPQQNANRTLNQLTTPMSSTDDGLTVKRLSHGSLLSSGVTTPSIDATLSTSATHSGGGSNEGVGGDGSKSPIAMQIEATSSGGSEPLIPSEVAPATSGSGSHSLRISNNRPTKRWSTSVLASPSSLIIPAHHQLPPHGGSSGTNLHHHHHQSQHNHHQHNNINFQQQHQHQNHLSPMVGPAASSVANSMAESSSSPYLSFNSLLGASLTQPTTPINHRLREVERKRSYNLTKHYPYIPNNNCFASGGLIDGRGGSATTTNATGSGSTSWQSGSNDPLDFQNRSHPATSNSPTKQRAFTTIHPLSIVSQSISLSVPSSPRTLVTTATNFNNTTPQADSDSNHMHHPQCLMASGNAAINRTSPTSNPTATTANWLQLQAALAAMQQQQQQQQQHQHHNHLHSNTEPQQQLQLESAIQNLSLKKNSETQMPYQLQLAATVHQLNQRQDVESSQLAAALEALRCDQQHQQQQQHQQVPNLAQLTEIYKQLPPQMLTELLLSGQDNVSSSSQPPVVDYHQLLHPNYHQNLTSSHQLDGQTQQQQQNLRHQQTSPHTNNHLHQLPPNLNLDTINLHSQSHQGHLLTSGAGAGSVLADERLMLAAQLVEKQHQQQRLLLASQPQLLVGHDAAATAASLCQQNQLMEQQLLEHLRLRGQLAAANLELQQLNKIPSHSDVVSAAINAATNGTSGLGAGAGAALVPEAKTSITSLPFKKRKISEPNMRY